MKCFYAYVDTEEALEKTLSKVHDTHPEIREDHIYIDKKSQEEWNRMVEKLENFDELYCQDMSVFAVDGDTLFEKLSFLRKNDIRIRLLDDTALDAKEMMNLIEFVRSTQKKQHYEKQMEGIHRALEKKRKGEGDYGRPKIILPEDFEENIRKIMKKEMKHDEYRARLGFKRSTYFKLVKNLKDSWKQQEMEQSLCKNGKD